MSASSPPPPNEPTAAATPQEPEPKAPPIEEPAKVEAPKEAEAEELDAGAVEEEPAEAPKVEAPKDPEPEAEEPKAEDAKPEEPKTEEAKAEEAKTEEAKAEEAQVDEPPAEEAKVEEPKKEEPPPEPPPPPPAPVVASYEPSIAYSRGGEVLVVLGADFDPACVVLIDGTKVVSARIHSGKLEAILPKHAAGEVEVTVENPDGQKHVAEKLLRYSDPPRVNEVQPAAGTTVGGAEVRLLGEGFEPDAAVIFGDQKAEAIWVSATEIKAWAPEHPVGDADVTVRNPDGLEHRLALAFHYKKSPPSVASVEPPAGPNAGGTKLTVKGAAFDAKVEVYVCGIAAKVEKHSGSELLVVAPPVARDGLVDVRVVNVDGQSATAEKAFRYLAPMPPPVLGAVSPTRGSQVGGLELTLVGADFAEGCVVKVGGQLAKTKFKTHREIRALTPMSAEVGELDVEVVNPDGVSATLEKVFTSEPRPKPEITGVNPPNGLTLGGTRVTIEGKNFTKGCHVYLNREKPRDMVVKSLTEIILITAPTKVSGFVDVEVSAPGIAKSILKNGFRYDAAQPPQVASFTPGVGPVRGAVVTIVGKNFVKETEAFAAGKRVDLKLVSPTSIEIALPPGPSGRKIDVLLRNPDGKEVILRDAYMYDARQL